MLLRRFHRLTCRAPGSKPVAVIGNRPATALLQNLHHRLLDKSIQHRRNAQPSHSSVRLRNFHPLHRLRLIGSTLQLFPDRWPVLLQKSWQLLDRHAVHAGTPLISLDSFQCLLAVILRADFFHQRFGNGRTFGPALRRGRFGPFRVDLRGFTPTLCPEGQLQLGFLPLVAHESRGLLAAPFTPLRRTVWAFGSSLPTLPAADFCRPVRVNRSTLIPVFETSARPPQANSTAFRPPPPDFH